MIKKLKPKRTDNDDEEAMPKRPRNAYNLFVAS